MNLDEMSDKAEALLVAVQTRRDIHKYPKDEIPTGTWLIEAGKLEPGTGMSWVEDRSIPAAVYAALEAQYGKGSFDFRTHGVRYYAWRNF